MRLSPTDFRLRPIFLLIATLGVVLTGTGNTLAQGQDSIDLPEGLTIHVVHMNESLAQIADDYGVSIAKMQTANNISPGESISVGARLIIPGKIGSTRRLYDEAFVFSETDNLYTLARLSNTDADLLGNQLSAVNPYGFYAGQSVVGPPVAHSFGDGRKDALHRLALGESAIELALKYDIPIYALAGANDILDPVLLTPGSMLRVPPAENSDEVLYSPWQDIEIAPDRLQTGRTFSIVVQTDVPGTMRGQFLEQDIPFVTDGTTHETVVGVSRWQDPGVFPLDLFFDSSANTTDSITINLQLAYGGYISESLRIPEDIAAVLNDPQAVQAEIAYVASVMSGITPDPLWNDVFLLPATGVMTSSYGTLRSYNGSGFNTFHSGADLAARTGTPIFAPADGVVVNIAELDVRGLVTMIDHGFGVYTGYWHQSSILVDPGDTVARGQQIGAIGSTGLSTAAHLHWELWIRGTQVDAMQWVRESFP